MIDKAIEDEGLEPEQKKPTRPPLTPKPEEEQTAKPGTTRWPADTLLGGSSAAPPDTLLGDSSTVLGLSI